MCLTARPACRRTVSAVRVTPLRTMKTSPDLMPTGETVRLLFGGFWRLPIWTVSIFLHNLHNYKMHKINFSHLLHFFAFAWYFYAELDPTRVCKGKGAVTLRATLVHIDDEESSSKEPPVNAAKSELKRKKVWCFQRVSALNISQKQYGARLIVVYYNNGLYEMFVVADNVGLKCFWSENISDYKNDSSIRLIFSINDNSWCCGIDILAIDALQAKLAIKSLFKWFGVKLACSTCLPK